LFHFIQNGHCQVAKVLSLNTEVQERTCSSS
jgi:hypothetical protein